MGKKLTENEKLNLFEKLTREIKENASTLTDNEARYLVDTYYQMQDFRISTNNQLRSAEKGDDTFVSENSALCYIANSFETLENNIKLLLKAYAESKPIGRWLLSITGIGPVIAAGLIAHIDIKKVQTAGQIQAYAGLDPTKKWEKGQKRPWNAKLKVLCWKVGQSFVKVSNNEKDVYGKIYKERKAYEIEQNEKGAYAEQAAKKLASTKIGKDTDAYKWYSEGKLPPAHIQQRAERYATKIFISHLFTVWYEMEHGVPAPKPYAEAILNHAHIIAPPNFEDVKKFMQE